MKKTTKRVLAFIMALCLLTSSAQGVLAAETEEYLSELRIVYADSKEEAEEIMDETYPDEEYSVLDYNLNNETGKQAVWLAYLTTTDIDESITDLAVMPMQGGYQEGNYQEMIAQSRSEYEATAAIYARAIEYFIEAYDAGDFLAECAYRQLNFYCDEQDNEGELLGDLFLSGMDPLDLATIFMQGNSYALENIRALIAMGVSYNDDGAHYMEHVAEQAEAMDQDGAEIFEEEDDFDLYESYANMIAISISSMKTMFEELETVEDELNYEDEEVTETEMQHLQGKAMAEITRAVVYLGGETLYDFCLAYEHDEEDLTSLYPLVAALNEGQKNMVLTGHYFDVVRYSMETMPEEEMDAEIAELEAVYGEMPFDIYTGVDRSVYTGSFALTSEAYRGDASSETGAMDDLLNLKSPLLLGINIGAGVVGIGSLIWAVTRTVKNKSFYDNFITDRMNEVGLRSWRLITGGNTAYSNVNAYINDMISTYKLTGLNANATFADKVAFLDANKHLFSSQHKSYLGHVKYALKEGAENAEDIYAMDYPHGYYNSIGTGFLFALGGVMMIYSAVTLLITAFSEEHPEYDDVPVAMVDLISTEDGDRYIKYDGVREAENPDAVGDLNGFEAERWNALYYTKSYEAGKPLLADFNVSTNNNVADDNYLPIHKFGEVICYNLNKFNFDSDSESIYVSVLQSENQKSAVEDVPEIVGSMVSSGYIFLAAGLGILAGIGGTLGVQALRRKKK